MPDQVMITCFEVRIGNPASPVLPVLALKKTPLGLANSALAESETSITYSDDKKEPAEIIKGEGKLQIPAWGWLILTVLSQELAAVDKTTIGPAKTAGSVKSAGSPKSSVAPKKSKSPQEEYKDVIQVNKYSPALRDFVAKILKAISIFDCFDVKVRETRPFFNEGLGFSASAFDALSGLKRSQVEYTKTISNSLISLRDMEKGFMTTPDVISGFDDSDKSCFSGGVMFTKEDCQSCKQSTPSFKTKHLAKIEMRVTILQMQENIPKQFLYYASDIFIITAEAIRIMDKILTCQEKNGTKCESRDKTIARFNLKMRGVVQKEKDHVKMISFEKIKAKEMSLEDLPKELSVVCIAGPSEDTGKLWAADHKEGMPEFHLRPQT
ncbi:hypothetical protein GE061_019945 [Apolygus lucorum]|uniref:Uncharacterized protein n=1 Tax=Apolygus lucorum TaxID=248454 RepID=A0A8S9X9U0_APOLU|nr:hypothetical protein GE061_019945 [Apolygus lucorum]